jgi:hypothetical protein
MGQDNLVLYAEINSIAFGDIGTQSVPMSKYAYIVETVLDSFSKTSLRGKFTSTSENYIHSMLGRKTAHDPRRSEVWIGTEIKDDEEHIVLLPAAMNVLNILRNLEQPKASIGASSLDTLIKDLSHTVSQLKGDEQAQVKELTTQRDALDKKIRDLQRNGVKELDATDRKEISEVLLNTLDQIRNGFAQAPRSFKKVVSESDAIYNEADDSVPQGTVQATILAKKKTWEREPESRILASLYQLEIQPIAKNEMLTNLESFADLCSDILTPEQKSQIVRFLPRMTGIAKEIHDESLSFWRGLLAHISNPEFHKRRQDILAVKKLMELMDRVTLEIQPSAQEPKLKGYGFRIPERTNTPLLSDLKLNLTPPEETDTQSQNADVVLNGDNSEAEALLIKKNTKNAYMNKTEFKRRLDTVMGDNKSVTFSDVLQRWPLHYGEEEIAAWMNYGAHSTPSVLHPDKSFVLTISFNGMKANIQCPDIEFLNPVFKEEGISNKGFKEGDTVPLLSTHDLRALGHHSEPHLITTPFSLTQKVTL